MSDTTIRERLDILDGEIGSLDGAIGELVFKEQMLQGWKCKTSSSGMKISTLDLDLNECSWYTGTGLYGCYSLSGGFTHDLPINYFSAYPIVMVSAWAEGGQFMFLPIMEALPSTAYIGDYSIYIIDKSETYANFPETLHISITAMGF